MTDWLALSAAGALALAGITAITAGIGRAHHHIVEHIDRQIRHLEGFTMTAAQDAVNAVVGQLRKAQLEIVTKIAEVQDQLDSAGVAEEVDLSELTAAAQALDDIVPDVPEVPDTAPTEVQGEPAEVDAASEV